MVLHQTRPGTTEGAGATPIRDAIYILMRERACGPDEAAQALRERARANAQPIGDVAVAIVAITTSSGARTVRRA